MTSNLLSNDPVPAPGGNPVSPSPRKYKVEQLTYLAIEGKIKLFYIQTEQKFNLVDDFRGFKPGKQKIAEMLEEFIEDEDKISLIQKRVKELKLDIRDPHDLVEALAAAYQ